MDEHSFVSFQKLNQGTTKESIEAFIKLINSHEYVINLKEELKCLDLHLTIGHIDYIITIVLLDKSYITDEGLKCPKMYKYQIKDIVSLEDMLNYLKQLNTTYNHKKDL